jgi:hypothetical protein
MRELFYIVFRDSGILQLLQSDTSDVSDVDLPNSFLFFLFFFFAIIIFVMLKEVSNRSTGEEMRRIPDFYIKVRDTGNSCRI